MQEKDIIATLIFRLYVLLGTNYTLTKIDEQNSGPSLTFAFLLI